MAAIGASDSQERKLHGCDCRQHISYFQKPPGPASPPDSFDKLYWQWLKKQKPLGSIGWNLWLCLCEEYPLKRGFTVHTRLFSGREQPRSVLLAGAGPEALLPSCPCVTSGQDVFMFRGVGVWRGVGGGGAFECWLSDRREHLSQKHTHTLFTVCVCVICLQHDSCLYKI